MKKIFLLLCVACTVKTIHAQAFDLKWSGQQKYDSKNDYIENLFYADKNSFFYDITSRAIKSGALKVDFHTVNRMSTTDFKLLTTENIFTDKKIQDGWEPVNFVSVDSKSTKVNDGFLVWLKKGIKGGNSFGCIKYSAEGKKSVPQSFLTINNKEDIVEYPALITSASTNLSKVGLVFQNDPLYFDNRTFICTVLDNNGIPVWKNTLKISEHIEGKFTMSQCITSDNGNLLLFGYIEKETEIKKKNDDLKKPEETVLCFIMSNNGKDVQKIKLKDMNFEFAKLFVDKKTNNFCVAGSYNDDAGVPKGIIFSELNSSGEIINTIKKPLPPDYNEAINKMEQLSSKKEEGRYIHINDVLFNEKNEMIIIGEYRSAFKWQHEEKMQILNNIWKAKNVENYIFNYNDLYCMKINEQRNDINFVARIPKTQRTKDRYQTLKSFNMLYKDKIMIIRNHIEQNNTGVSNKFKENSNILLSTETAELVADIIDAKGNYTQQSIYKKLDMDRLIYPKNIIALLPDKLLFTAADTKAEDRKFTWFQVTDYFGIITIKE